MSAWAWAAIVVWGVCAILVFVICLIETRRIVRLEEDEKRTREWERHNRVMIVPNQRTDRHG